MICTCQGHPQYKCGSAIDFHTRSSLHLISAYEGGSGILLYFKAHDVLSRNVTALKPGVESLVFLGDSIIAAIVYYVQVNDQFQELDSIVKLRSMP
jgi:hypothetical protein